MPRSRLSRTDDLFTKLARRFFAASLILLSANQYAIADEISLSWNDNSDNEDGFNIERSVDEGAFEIIGTVGTDIVTYVDQSAVSGVSYRYRVNAFNSFGFSGYTNVASEYINVTPSISSFEPVSLDRNGSVEGIAFDISDFETIPSALSIVATSSNESLIAAANIVISGSGTERYLSLAPLANSVGESQISITVSDGEDSVTASFLLSVLAPELPTLQLAIETIGAEARAGEAFYALAETSDNSLVARVDFLVDGQVVSQDSAAPFEASLSISEAGSHNVRAVARLEGSEDTVSKEQVVFVGEAPFDASLLAEFRTSSLGESGSEGSASYDLASDSFYLEDDSGKIAGTMDSHRFFYLRAEGDVTITARLEDLQTSSGQAVGGLMIRSALYGRAAHGALLVNGSASIETRSRAEKGGSTVTEASLAEVSDQAWLRIEKKGSSLSYFMKSDEAGSWTLLRSETLSLGENTFVGLALASGVVEQSSAATFAKVSFVGSHASWDDSSMEPEVPSGLTITKLD